MKKLKLEKKKILTYGLSIGFPIILTGLLNILLTKNLSVEKYGIYSLQMTNIGFYQVIFFSGLGNTLIRLYPIYKEKILGNILLYFIVISISLSTISIIFSKFFNPLSLITSIFLGLNVINVSYFRILQKEKKYLINIVTVNSLKLFLIFYYRKNLSIEMILYCIIITNILVNIDLLFKTINTLFQRKKYFNIEIVKKIFQVAVSLVLISLLNQVLANVDKYMLKQYSTFYELGLYSFYYKIGEISLGNIPKVILLASYPIVIYKFEQSGNEGIKKELKKVLLLQVIISLAVMILLIFILPRIIEVYFNKFFESFNLFIGIGIGIGINGFSQIYIKDIELKQRYGLIGLLLFIAILTNILLNYIYIPKYGALAASITTIISYLCYLITTIIAKRYYLN